MIVHLLKLENTGQREKAIEIEEGDWSIETESEEGAQKEREREDGAFLPNLER